MIGPALTSKALPLGGRVIAYELRDTMLLHLPTGSREGAKKEGRREEKEGRGSRGDAEAQRCRRKPAPLAERTPLSFASFA
jgi:hypothetical protein